MPHRTILTALIAILFAITLAPPAAAKGSVTLCGKTFAKHATKVDLEKCKTLTDAGLKQLAGLKALKSLNLSGTKVTDAGLKHLAGLKALQKLDLEDTKVTDAGLKHLAGLKALRRLHLEDTTVTNAGISKLKRALPNCDIRK